MITARRTRLVRVADLHAFRSASVALSLTPDLDLVRSTAVVVPTRGAARQLRRTCEDAAFAAGSAVLMPDFVTRAQLYDLLHGRLRPPLRRLTAFERDANMAAAARDAASACPPPFRIRPALVAEMVRFYDELRRQRQSIERFEELLSASLERDADLDRGAARMLEQTRFLAQAFRRYVDRLAAMNAVDEHTLRDRLLDAASQPLRRVVITVADWIADPQGLYAADFDLLTRLPDLESIDVVATERLLGSGFHQRIHEWLPGIEEVAWEDPRSPRPVLAAPQRDDGRFLFECRDREEELVSIARRLKHDRPAALERVGVVFRRPLPYLYLARSVFGDAKVPYETQDGLPLAAEPAAAALDLVLEAAASGLNRESIVALLRSPHFRFGSDRSAEAFASGDRERDSIAALDRALSDARYLGEIDRLRELPDRWRSPTATPVQRRALWALEAALEAASSLEPLGSTRPMSEQIRTILSVFSRFGAPASGDPAVEVREARARAAVLTLLESLASACAEHDDQPADVDLVRSELRRWLEDETFVPEPGGRGVQVLDAQAARYANVDDLTIVGVIEGEWPERPRRNIFYPAALLATLGWPPEHERRGAAVAAFVDLLGSPARRVAVSTFTLDDEALVEPSVLAEEIETAHLRLEREAAPPDARVFTEEALSLEPLALGALDTAARAWASLRLSRTPASADSFHGSAGQQPVKPRSVSAIERYLKCPFQFYAQHVLKLEDEPDDDEVMDPKRQGLFIHGVFEAFFTAWQERGRREITPADLGDARELFADICEDHLATLPEAEAGIERTRLLGSPVAPGLGDIVFRMESERPVPVLERMLEYHLEGTFTFKGDNGPREIALRGVADRIDLLADGTLRIIDYKLSSAPNKAQALQLPIYGLCAEQALAGHAGREWTLGDGFYIAFRGGKAAKRIVPLFGPRSNRDEDLADAQQRLIDAVDGIERGDFPPRPPDEFLCSYCSYGAVCRKDYR